MTEEEKQERLRLTEELAGLNDEERKAFIAEMYE